MVEEEPMNKMLVLGAIGILFFSAVPSSSQVEVSVGLGLKFNELNDYGEWVHVQGLGQVWRPDAEEGWRPFTYGRWVYSNDGWLWDSDEPFGWIVCHYGNWYQDDEWGWVWVPGYEWSPARVEWYVTDNEIGWAPMFPPSHRNRFNRVHWSFCPINFFASGDVHGHLDFRLRPARAGVGVFTYAPKIEFVQRHHHSPIVRINPRRVTVAHGDRSFVRMELEDRHHDQSRVVVPVGRQFRKVRVHSEPDHHAEVVPSHVEESRSVVRPVERDRERVVVQPREERERSRVVVPSKNESEKTVEVRSRSDRHGDDKDDNSGERKRIRVESRH